MKYTWNIHERFFRFFFRIIEDVISDNVINQYTREIFFFCNIEEVISYENDCSKSIYMSHVFPPYYLRGDNVVIVVNQYMSDAFLLDDTRK